MTGGYPVGVLAGVVVALIAVAGVLSMHDGGLPGGVTAPGNVGAATFPPLPTFGAIATAPPESTPASHGHGHGHGH